MQARLFTLVDADGAVDSSEKEKKISGCKSFTAYIKKISYT
jgi:hypothetical protein